MARRKLAYNISSVPDGLHIIKLPWERFQDIKEHNRTGIYWMELPEKEGFAIYDNRNNKKKLINYKTFEEMEKAAEMMD